MSNADKVHVYFDSPLSDVQENEVARMLGRPVVFQRIHGLNDRTQKDGATDKRSICAHISGQ